MAEPIFQCAGDQGIVVEYGQEIDPLIHRQVMGLYHKLKHDNPPWLIEAIPTYRSLLVLFAPEQTQGEDLIAELKELGKLAKDYKGDEVGRQMEIPTVYGGEEGPDLDEVASLTDLDPEEVTEIHAAGKYIVYMLGFTPGFPYLGGMDKRIAAPRLPSPRTEIPSGSVGIAGPQTGVYPQKSPGGWRIIGRTPLTLFDPKKDPPAYLQPGDQITFKPITRQEADQMSKTQKSVISREKKDNGKEAAALIKQPGMLTTVQDKGRWGYQHLGVPTAGAMDRLALHIGNILTGNHQGAPALEMTMTGPKIYFYKDCVIAVTGADLGPCVNGREIPMWTSLKVAAGSVVHFSGRKNGCRGYLSLAGGLKVPTVMGSSSTYLRGSFGGLQGRALKAGDEITLSRGRPCLIGAVAPKGLFEYLDEKSKLQVVLGPQEDYVSAESLKTFFSSTYTVSPQADRMGYRLDGPKLEHARPPDIISDGICPGAVQVPGHGAPIVMTADRQTTGGYPKIGAVTSLGLSSLAQRIPGDAVSFEEVSFAQALKAYKDKEDELAQWRRDLEEKLKNKGKTWRLTIDGHTHQVMIGKSE